ncbi:MAG TPA: putative glycoside hydrolase [Gemmatimonadaceae bacterium]|nr:putative glycoside hydrolase [Gemmatimonadaceae bacterium]
MTRSGKLFFFVIALTTTACAGARDATSENPLPASASSTPAAVSSAPPVEAAPTVVPDTKPAGAVASARPVTQSPSASGTVVPAPARPLVAGVHPTPPVLDSLIRGTLAARGLYVFRFGANTRRMKHLIGIADSTEINALVIDVKDEFGLNFNSSDPLLQKNGGTQVKSQNLRALVDSLRAHGILPIARIVVFKDSVAARNNPEHTIRQPDGSAWRDKQGLTWVNPYANEIWEYNLRVGDEAIRMGFGEIQFDYIRFPEPYRSLPRQVFPGQNGRSKPEVLAEFLSAARARYAKAGVRTTADVFGLVTTVPGALEIGQAWEPLAKAVDVMLPMVYPSHYPRGSFNIDRPNAAPYEIIHAAISRARERNEKLGLTGEAVRPWLQAFSIGNPKYGPAEIEAQKQAVYDSGYDGWVMWEPGTRYDIFLPALEKTFISRKKNPPVPRGTRRESSTSQAPPE